MALIMDIAPPAAALPPKKRRLPRLLLAGAAVLIIVVLAGLMFSWHHQTTVSPVPAKISRAVPFPVYYPQPQKLPAGYSLDTASFQLAEAGVVIYSALHNGQRLVFSEEQQPGGNVIDKFTSGDIPLHTELKTGLGTAEFGAYGSGQNLRTIVSLPIHNGPWLIITAPPAASHDDLVRIVQALTK